METLVLLWLLGPYLALSLSTVVDAVRRFYRRRMQHGVILLALLMGPFVLVNAPNARQNANAFANGLLALGAYALVPGALAMYRQKTAKPRPLDLADALVILIVWLPVEFGWLPAMNVTALGQSIPLGPLTSVVLVLLIFLVLRPLTQIGYTFALTRTDLRRAGAAALAFAAVAVPLGLLVGFLRWRPPAFINLELLIVRFVITFLLVGLPEELIYRGVLQNLIEKRTGEKRAALVIAAVIFGAAHLNTPPAPNYTYALLGTLAGVAYGWVWMRTRKITAAALTHTLVNWVWVWLLGG
ncbi:MAG: hypothetical protein Kow00120_01260 [Anaerolineae bacterium]